jgi:serine phosphatase RsbU (regulator of sigma subunit)
MHSKFVLMNSSFQKLSFCHAQIVNLSGWSFKKKSTVKNHERVLENSRENGYVSSHHHQRERGFVTTDHPGTFGVRASVAEPGFARLVGLWLLCVVFPCVLLEWSSSHLLDQRTGRKMASVGSDLQNTVRRIRELSEESAWVHRFCHGRTFAGEETPPLFGYSAPTRSSRVAGLNEIRLFLEEKLIPDASQVDAWRNLCGWSFDPVGLQKKPGIPVSVYVRKKPAWIFWEQVGFRDSPQAPASSSGLVRVALLRPPEPYVRTRSVLRHMRQAGFQKIFLLDLARRRYVCAGVSDQERREILKQTGQRSGFGVSEQGAYLVTRIQPGVFLYLEKRIPGPQPGTRWFLPILLVIFCGFSLMMLWRRDFRLQEISFAWRLPGAFLLLILVPLLVGFPLWLRAGSDQETVDRLFRREKAWQELLQVDQGFIAQETETSRAFDRFQSAEYWSAEGWKKLEQLMRELFSRDRILFSLAFDWQGKPLFLVSPVLRDLGLESVVKLVAEKGIRRYFGRFSEPRMTPNFESGLDLIYSPLFASTGFREGSGKLNRFEVDKNSFYLFWLQKSPEESPAMSMFALTVLHSQLADAYLSKRLPGNGPIRVLVRHNDSRKCFPDIDFPDRLEEVCREIGQSQDSRETEIVLNGQEYDVVGIPGRNLKNYCLLALSRRETSATDFSPPAQRNLFLGIFGFLVLGSYYLLRATILEPVREITLGLSALRSGRLAYRIPTQGRDEMGRLAEAFNHLIETVGELDAARVIQENLQVRKLPDIPGFQISLVNRVRGDLGGDYVDCLAMGQNRWAILIGDAFGDGVYIALTMSMAKSLIVLHLEESLPAAELFSRLNQAFCRLPGSRKMISLGVLFLDAGTARGELYLAGMPFPYRYERKSSRTEMVGVPGYPLGASTRQHYVKTPLVFADRDLMVLYSDGVIQALSEDQEVFGFTRIPEFLHGHPPESAEAFSGDLEKLLAGHIGEHGVVKDYSWFSLFRRSEQAGGNHG